MQRSIIYCPVREMFSPEVYGLKNVREVRHGNLVSWYYQGQDNKPLIVYFQGNTGNFGDRIERFELFIEKGFGLFAVGYSGYGKSAGKPSEAALYNDAREAIQYLVVNGHKTGDMILYGESLGSGIAVQIATENNFKAVVLEAPYASVVSIAKERYPYIPVDLLVKDRFDSLSKMYLITSPLLIFHGELDDVIPIHNSRLLIDAASNAKKKEVHFFDHTHHTNFDIRKLLQIIGDFIK